MTYAKDKRGPPAICHKDGRPCYVGRGTDDAHWRCGTIQCKAPSRAQEALDAAELEERGQVEVPCGAEVVVFDAAPPRVLQREIHAPRPIRTPSRREMEASSNEELRIVGRWASEIIADRT